MRGRENNRQKMSPGDIKNWWYYHKWYVILGAVLVFLLCRWIGSALGLFVKKPDLQIAYVGAPLPDDTAKALQGAFAQIAGDYNRDGEVAVEVHLFSGNEKPVTDEEFYYQYASEVELIGDITDCESYLFVTDNPADLQKRFQILACADGSEPEATDFSTEDKGFLWKGCGMLSGIDTGLYRETALGETAEGSNADILGELFVGRRFFHDEKTVRNLAECEALWEQLAASAGTSAEAAVNESERDTESDDPVVPELPDADETAELNTSGIEAAQIGPVSAPSSFDGFSLLDNKDILTASGLYYAAWVSGEPVPYTNSDGEDVDLYDAQIYLLIQERENPEDSENDRDSWLSSARSGYHVAEEKEMSIGDNSYTILSYTMNRETSPFSRGVSAFAVKGKFAFLAELTCRDGFDGDPGKILLDFLRSLRIS